MGRFSLFLNVSENAFYASIIFLLQTELRLQINIEITFEHGKWFLTKNTHSSPFLSHRDLLPTAQGESEAGWEHVLQAPVPWKVGRGRLQEWGPQAGMACFAWLFEV